jgi:hypothetical protein
LDELGELRSQRYDTKSVIQMTTVVIIHLLVKAPMALMRTGSISDKESTVYS